jgi:hypothetical protein
MGLSGVYRYMQFFERLEERLDRRVLPTGQAVWIEATRHRAFWLSRYYIQLAPGQPQELISEVYGPPETAEAWRLERLGSELCLLAGTGVYTRRGTPPRWLYWSVEEDEETGLFLRHFDPKVDPTVEALSPRPPRARPGWWQEQAYGPPEVNATDRTLRVRSTGSKASGPRTLVYSARDTGPGWQFDLGLTQRANTELRSIPFPSDAVAEVWCFEAPADQTLKFWQGPEGVLEGVKGARTRRATFPLLTEAWATTAALPLGMHDEIRGAYGDPNARWVMLYQRWPGSKGHTARQAPVGGWMTWSISTEVAGPPGPRQTRTSRALFLRILSLAGQDGAAGRDALDETAVANDGDSFH